MCTTTVLIKVNFIIDLLYTVVTVLYSNNKLFIHGKTNVNLLAIDDELITASKLENNYYVYLIQSYIHIIFIQNLRTSFSSMEFIKTKFDRINSVVVLFIRISFSREHFSLQFIQMSLVYDF